MLLKNRGGCPICFLPHFKFNQISVSIALPARMWRRPVLVICACFLCSLCGCSYIFSTNSLCPVFLVWVEGGQAAVFHNWCNCQYVSYAWRQTLFNTPWDCKHHFYHVGTTGSVIPVKLFPICMRQSKSEGNSCSCLSPFFFECCPCWFPAVPVQLWGANGVHWEHLSQKEISESVSSWMIGDSHTHKKG